ncbi:MAG TPA: cation:dicarboxylase symporter family transporter, partial [Candidatus Babeliaceae bacterium]|nr:cation:dicarboxylase symporter family transporter [Candidatus Babeliaceae bacterium]
MLTFFRSSLTFQMVLATLLGILAGLFFGDLCSVFAPWENAYIMILKITTIPYLICAVIHGIGRLATSTAKQILQKGLLFIGGIWAINIALIYMTVFL